jgi:peptide deformylase
MFEELKIIHWPDPRLLRSSEPVESFNPELRALADRMLELMREARGVGLAAPQVGQNIRLFVMNHTGKPEDDRVFVNPILDQPDGEEEGEEGCLSLPGVNVKILRSGVVTLAARDVEGHRVEQREAGYLARIWQHEIDHLEGTLLVDRMGPLARMANRRTLKDLEEEYLTTNPPAKAAPRKRSARL